MEPALTMHGCTIGWQLRLVGPLNLPSGKLGTRSEGNYTRPACCSEFRKGLDKRVTSSDMCADLSGRHLLFSTIQSGGLQLLFFQLPMISP